MRRRAAITALVFALVPGCGTRDDVAAILLGETRDSGALDAETPPAFDVIGQPWEGQWSFGVADWPLDGSLADFFAPAPGRGGGRVSVPPEHRAALWRLRVAVAARTYGPQQDAVVVEDGGGTRYLIVFPADDRRI